MEHDWELDSDGNPKAVFDSNEYPYCIYLYCMRCKEYFCDAGCSGDLNYCESNQLNLFE
jgi:hypothetical protein